MNQSQEKYKGISRSCSYQNRGNSDIRALISDFGPRERGCYEITIVSEYYVHKSLYLCITVTVEGHCG
jgi:hypothetical protein